MFGPRPGAVLTLSPLQDRERTGWCPCPVGAFQCRCGRPVQATEFLDRQAGSHQPRIQAVCRRRWIPRIEGLEGIVPRRRARAGLRGSGGAIPRCHGQGGPSWELGSFPQGQADFRLAASAGSRQRYAAFAGKALPTIYHGSRGSARRSLIEILELSNFDGKGAVQKWRTSRVGPWGTLDMAGNVKEWCINRVQGGRAALQPGGGWNEPPHRYHRGGCPQPLGPKPTLGCG